MALALTNSLLSTLPTSMLNNVLENINQRLHINPGGRLAYELNSIILSHLSLQDVMRCSTLSREWWHLTRNAALWKSFYLQEGWAFDQSELSKYRKCDQNTLRIERRASLSKCSLEESLRKRCSRKALRDQEGIANELECLDEQALDGDDMHICTSEVTSCLPGETQLSSNPSLNGHKPPNNEEGDNALDWANIYKQRRRLEDNWDQGLFNPFQLPHPSYPEEGHEECVYSIQFHNNCLVSGSRDRTIKIWDLESQRCLRTLKDQHTQSVLCLQFDIEQDILISGGSDMMLVIWRFSTGQVIKTIQDAHEASVLNLRFDHRYLVTCSGDKSIKIWNRHDLLPNDELIPIPEREAIVESGVSKIEAFTELMLLQGHNAAVNAVQIHGNKIVSASGDRSIKMWDILTGDCLAEFNQHNKGIACVHFDGHRIISGSSDRTIKIFDVKHGTEIGELVGHTNLVRTVQARFGDGLSKIVPDDPSELMDNNGTLNIDLTTENGKQVEEHVKSLQGSKWARIVSGSYDQTVVIWKKYPDGKWMPRHRLQQDGSPAMTMQTMNIDTRTSRPDIHSSEQNKPFAQRLNIFQSFNSQSRQAILLAASLTLNGRYIPSNPLANYADPTQVSFLRSFISRSASTILSAHSRHQASTNAEALHRDPNATPSTVPWNVTPQSTAAVIAALTNAPHPFLDPNANNNTAEGTTNRVFKVQFDTRRIICCSQSNVIRGWDFANGDEEIEKVCRFFEETD